MKLSYIALLIFLAFISTGCILPNPHPAAPLAIRPLDVGPARAQSAPLVRVVDGGDQLLVVTREGATLYRAGVAVANERRVFVAASTLPAADSNGRWLVAVDDGGALYRLRAGLPSERIGGRYGLVGGVRALCQAGPTRAAFLVAHELVIADGGRVKHYPVDWPANASLACGGDRVATRIGLSVQLFDGATGSQRSYALPPSADVALVVDEQGTLWVQTPLALYRATRDAPDLRLFYRAENSASLHGLVVAGRHVWLGEGDNLALIDGELVARTAPLRLDNPQLVAGSPSGDVWVTTPGRLSRLTRDDGALLPEERWAQQIAPVFTHACSACHLPTGRAGLDLSVASAWDTERDVIRERVVQKRTMPPPDHVMSEYDRQTISRWLDGS